MAERRARPTACASAGGSVSSPYNSASARATESASCVPEPRPACRGSDRCTQTRAPSRMWWWSRNRFANPDARCASGPCAVTVRALDADTSSVASGAAAPIPPNHRPSSPRRSSTPKCSRAGASTKTSRPAPVTISPPRRSGYSRTLREKWERSRVHHRGRRCAANVLNEQRHRLEFPRTGRLVDDDLQPLDLAEKELARQKVDTRGVDCRLEHRVACTIEADELPPDLAMHGPGVDSRSRRRAVDRGHLELAPRTRVCQNDTTNGLRGNGLIRRVADRRLCKHPHIIDEIDDGGTRGENISIRRGLQERLQDNRLRLRVGVPFHAHWSAVHLAILGDGGDDGLDDHSPHSRVTSAAYAAATLRVIAPAVPVPIGCPPTRTKGAMPRSELVRNASSASRNSSRPNGRSSTVTPSSAAISITAPRVMPGSAAHDVGGVASVPPITANRLLADASEQ